MNQFGVTNPCAKIAAHFNVPQAFVDACMEQQLVQSGVRARNNWPTHTHLYWAGKHLLLSESLKHSIHSALAAVCDDILELAKGK